MYPEVVAKAKAAANAEANSHNTTNLNLSQFDTRNPSPRGDHYCCPIQGQWNWLPALIQTLRQGIDYLNNFNGVCNTGGGPGNWFVSSFLFFSPSLIPHLPQSPNLTRAFPSSFILSTLPKRKTFANEEGN